MIISDIQVTPVHPERWGNDLDVVNAARVSFNKTSEFLEGNDIFLTEHGWVKFTEGSLVFINDAEVSQALAARDAKLINYLAKHKHTSPFNHSFITMRVKAPIFVARQLVKHKFMPWNEVSRRYVTDDVEFYMPKAYRLQAENVKQGSSSETITNFINPWGAEECPINDVLRQHIEACCTLYDALVAQKVCPEQARMVLPHNLMTEWIWSGTLGAWADMLRLRLDSHTQEESRIVAKKAYHEIEKIFPVSITALLND